MATVTVKATQETLEGTKASRLLESVGVHHEIWDVRGTIPRYNLDAGEQADLLATFQAPLDRLSAERGYVARDLIQLSPATPHIDELLVNFVRPHHHTEDEVRFIVHGEGVFTVERGSEWYDILVTAGDVIAVPAGTRHWFTLTDTRTVTAVRLFCDPSGWVAVYDDAQAGEETA